MLSLPPALVLFLVPMLVGVGEPRAVIHGPETAVAGDLLILDASDSEGVEHLQWKLIEPVIPGKKLVEADEFTGKRLRVATFPGRYKILLSVSNDVGIDSVIHIVTIPDPCPNPGPGPQPLPPGPLPPPPGPFPPPVPPLPPDPVLPAGEFGVSADVYKWALAVNSPSRPEQMKGLADAAEALAAQISAGTVRKIQDILNEIALALDTITDVDEAAYATFRHTLSVRISSLYAAKKLNSMDRWAVLIREVELGLRAASKR